MQILGMDIGGTHTRLGLVDAEGRLLYPCALADSRLLCGDEGPVSGIGSMIRSYLEQYGNPQMDAVSIGVPASVHDDFATVFCAPNLMNASGKHVLEETDLAAGLQKALGLPVLVNKDVNNLLYYDLAANGLTGITAACYIGTGLGTAVSMHGEVFYGAHGFAMDLGHMPLFHCMDPCSCGKTGCVESRISGTALLRLKNRYYPDTEIGELFAEHGTEEPLQAFVRDCAYLPAVLATVFDPDAIVLGGGVIEMNRFPRELMEQAVREQTGNAAASKPMHFVYAEKLAERGVIGAAVFAEKWFEEKRNQQGM